MASVTILASLFILSTLIVFTTTQSVDYDYRVNSGQPSYDRYLDGYRTKLEGSRPSPNSNYNNRHSELNSWINRLIRSYPRQSGRTIAKSSMTSPYKRHGFSAWAGKRSGSAANAQFVSHLRTILENRLMHGDLAGNKRQLFSAWAGKRSGETTTPRVLAAADGDEVDDSVGDDFKEQINADNLNSILNSKDESYDKRGFSSWSGKRLDDMDA